MSDQNINHYLMPGSGSLDQSARDNNISQKNDDQDLVIAQLINEMNNIKEVSYILFQPILIFIYSNVIRYASNR